MVNNSKIKRDFINWNFTFKGKHDISFRDDMVCRAKSVKIFLYVKKSKHLFKKNYNRIKLLEISHFDDRRGS